MVPFVQLKNRGGRIDFEVDKDLNFTLGYVTFEVGQENTHVLKAVRLFESETEEKSFLLDQKPSAWKR